MPSPTNKVGICEMCFTEAKLYKHSDALMCVRCSKLATEAVKYYSELGVDLKGRGVQLAVLEELKRLEVDKPKETTIPLPKY